MFDETPRPFRAAVCFGSRGDVGWNEDCIRGDYTMFKFNGKIRGQQNTTVNV